LSGPQLGNALNQASGENGASTTQAAFDASNQFMNVLLDHFSGGAGAIADQALGYAAEKKLNPAHAFAAIDRRATPALALRWNVWASGYGGSSAVSGDAASGTHSTTARIYGTAVGADYHLLPDTLVGFAIGGAGFNYGLDGGLGGGRADLFQAGTFVRHSIGAAYVSAALAYGWEDVTTDRTVTIAGTDTLHAEFNANTLAARGEAGYRFATGFGGVAPYAAIQSTSFMLPNYTENGTSGSTQFALSYASQTTTNVRTELGARADKSFLVSDGLFSLRGRFAWRTTAIPTVR
jgi:uncharacterized protein with beta-barrel porin domain